MINILKTIIAYNSERIKYVISFLVCIHSSFSKRFEIASTRKLEQVISTGVHSKQHKEKRERNKNPEIPFFFFETTAISKILGL